MDSSNVWKGLAFGGTASCIAEAFTLPVDVVKTRLQLQARGLVAAARRWRVPAHLPPSPLHSGPPPLRETL